MDGLMINSLPNEARLNQLIKMEISRQLTFTYCSTAPETPSKLFSPSAPAR